MIELVIDKNKECETIALVENGKLLEVYKNDEQSKTNRLEGNIYLGVVEDVVPGMQAAFIDFGEPKKGFIYLKDILPQVDEKEQKIDRNMDIKKIIKPKDKLLVQVKKDSNEKKGAKVSTHISLPSKYIVLMPNTDIITISQKIENHEKREHLLGIVKQALPENTGAVIRTSAEKVSEEELLEDIKNVLEKWNKIFKIYQDNIKKDKMLIAKSASIAEKIVIDLVAKKIEKVTTNSKEEYDSLSNMVQNIEFTKEQDLLNRYDLKSQIQKLQNRKIWLNCGGFITIDRTEALTAIDVNTGKFTGNKDLETTIFKVNKEATIEIAKQLRLRDIGGIIIIDYIDMRTQENKDKIEDLLKEELKKDRAKTQVEGFTKLNLMELTRKHICSHLDE